jgi:hypothetical protein
MSKTIKQLAKTTNNRALKAWSLVLWIVLAGLSFLAGCKVTPNPIVEYGPRTIVLYGAPYNQYMVIDQLTEK